MSQLCNVCRNLPWDQFDRQRAFRYAWWKKDSLQVPYEVEREVEPLTPIVSRQKTEEGQEPSELSYHKDIDELNKSSLNGCHICRFVLRGFVEYSMDGEGPRQQELAVDWFKENSCDIQVTHHPASGILNFSFSTPTASRIVSLRYYFVSPNPRDMTEAFRPKLASSAASSHTFNVIDYWAKKCERLHAECREARQSDPELPTRVVDVGTSDCPGVPFLHISSPGQRARYIALSHRWGVGAICQTKTGVIERYCQALPLNELSNVFKNAIEVTRRLGIRYLWIDSLCIIQDSSADWETESSKMANIYTNASFTISAALSNDVDTGLFSFRDELLARPCRVDVKSPDDSTTETIRIWNETELLGLNLAYQYPLYTRAWVFQEHTLSPRILHFTPAGVYWECLAAKHVEAEPMRQQRWQDAPVKCPLLQPHDAQHWETHDKWLDLVEAYSGRDITFDADWLPAMSGIAKVFASLLGCSFDDYLAGIWRQNLLQSLAWYPSTARARGSTHGRPAEYVAPSWSWAAINGPVSFLVRHEGRRYAKSLTREQRWSGQAVPLCTVLDATTAPQGLDATGRVTSGEIILRGPVCENVFRKTSGGVWVRQGDAEGTPVEMMSPFELDVPGETCADSILLQVYEDFALILERSLGDGGVTYRRVGWCIVGEALSPGSAVIPRSLFQEERVVVIT